VRGQHGGGTGTPWVGGGRGGEVAGLVAGGRELERKKG